MVRDAEGIRDDASNLFSGIIGDIDASIDSFGIGNAEGIADDVSDFARFRVDESVPVRAGFRGVRSVHVGIRHPERRSNGSPQLLSEDGVRVENGNSADGKQEKHGQFGQRRSFGSPFHHKRSFCLICGIMG